MNTLLAKLPAFALPFVTRSLRGGRAQRYALLSALCAVVTLLMSIWIALGDGRFEQSVRVELGLEKSEWQVQRDEYVLITHDEDAFVAATQEAAEMERDGAFTSVGHSYTPVAQLRNHGLRLLARAAQSNTSTPGHVELHQQARALLGAQRAEQWADEPFMWGYPEEVAQLERVIERRGIPEVRLYHSPLAWGDALKLAGIFAGLILAACATVIAPLLVAVQQAQERHANTLLPLTGTALSSRALALGLAAGPSSVVLIFAAPQLLLFVGCALAVGKLLIALSFLAALAATGVFVILAAQLLAHLLGQRRTPGIIAIGLTWILVSAWGIGGLSLAGLQPEVAGVAALLPTLGLSGLLSESFSRLEDPSFARLYVATLAWSLAALVFAGLILSTLARKLENRRGACLGAPAALLGALICIGLVNLALPGEVDEEAGVRMYLGLAALALPCSVLLMARVPVGDEPPRMRRVPVAKLLAEFASWGAAHVVIALALSGADGNPSLHPVALLWLAWCALTLGLIAIRIVSCPATIAGYLVIGFCASSLVMGFSLALFWAFELNDSVVYAFPLSQVHPVLTLIQVALTVGIPVLLLRGLRRSLGSLGNHEASTPSESR